MPSDHPSHGGPSRPPDDLAILIRVLEELPADVEGRVAAVDVVLIVQATLREARR